MMGVDVDIDKSDIRVNCIGFGLAIVSLRYWRVCSAGLLASVVSWSLETVLMLVLNSRPKVWLSLLVGHEGLWHSV
jgi:hypothetical protein